MRLRTIMAMRIGLQTEARNVKYDTGILRKVVSRVSTPESDKPNTVAMYSPIFHPSDNVTRGIK
jgi:hypothetical protein